MVDPRRTAPSTNREVTVEPGDAFEATPGHDARVVGDEPCVTLDFWAQGS